MLRVLFFTQNRWAYGTIHHALAKELYKKGIYANLMDWTQTYSREEFKLLMATYDVFVTHPEAVMGMHHMYGVPLDRVVAMGHGQWDLLHSINPDFDFYPHLRNYGVISDVLKRKSAEFGISREPAVARLGIHFDVLYNRPSESLARVGYSGDKEVKNFFGEEIKRSHLVRSAVEGTGLELVEHSYYNHLCMPGYYRTIDAVVMSSTEEAGGLPMMEAAAAGRLPIGTPVGYFEENGPRGAGIVVPLEESQFVEKTRSTLCMFRDSPYAYRTMCEAAQTFARDNYDWPVVIDQWVELITC